jgi:hypothetical protein
MLKVLQSETGSLSGRDHRLAQEDKDHDKKKKPVTKERKIIT